VVKPSPCFAAPVLGVHRVPYVNGNRFVSGKTLHACLLLERIEISSLFRIKDTKMFLPTL
jgi:hypothetical protein